MSKTGVLIVSMVISVAMFFGATASSLASTFVDLPTTFVSAFLTNPDGTSMTRSDFLKNIGNDFQLMFVVGVPSFVIHLSDGYISKEEAKTTIERIIYFIEELTHD